MSGGGEPGLNSAKAIVPHAFLHRRGHDSIYHIEEEKLKELVYKHLWGGIGLSEFSSWAANLLKTLQYLRRGPTTYLVVLNTRQLPPRVTIFNTCELYNLGLSRGSFAHEFLVHGVVRRPTMRAVLWSDLQRYGIDSFLGDVAPYYPSNSRFELSLRREDIVAARKLAELFGRSLTFLMTVVFLTIITRKISRWTDGNFDDNELDLIIDCLANVDIPETLTRHATESLKKSYVQRYPELVQLLRLLPILSLRSLHKRTLEKSWPTLLPGRAGEYSRKIADVIEMLAKLGCAPQRLPAIKEQLTWIAPAFFGKKAWKSNQAARQLSRVIRAARGRHERRVVRYGNTRHPSEEA